MFHQVSILNPYHTIHTTIRMVGTFGPNGNSHILMAFSNANAQCVLPTIVSYFSFVRKAYAAVMAEGQLTLRYPSHKRYDRWWSLFFLLIIFFFFNCNFGRSKFTVHTHNFGQSKISVHIHNIGRSKITVQNHDFGRFKITVHNRNLKRSKITVHNRTFGLFNFFMV